MRYPRCFIAILLFLILPWASMSAAGNHVVLIMGGDVEWSLNSRPPTVRTPVVAPGPFGFLVFGKLDVRDHVIGDWATIPYVNEGESKAYLESLGLKGGSDDAFGESLSYPLQAGPEFTQDYSSNEELLNYPLRLLAPTFRAADLVFVNCEGALSDHARQVGLNRTPAKFAKAMRSSAVGLVNLANNHTFDAEERGFLDTLRALSSAGIAHVGDGHDLAEARQPVILARNGIKVGFPRDAPFNNMGDSAVAAHGRPGTVPA